MLERRSSSQDWRCEVEVEISWAVTMCMMALYVNIHFEQEEETNPLFSFLLNGFFPLRHMALWHPVDHTRPQFEFTKRTITALRLFFSP